MHTHSTPRGAQLAAAEKYLLPQRSNFPKTRQKKITTGSKLTLHCTSFIHKANSRKLLSKQPQSEVLSGNTWITDMLQSFKKGTKQTSKKECRQQRDIDLANHLHATGYLFQPHSKRIAQFPSSSFALPKLPVQHELHMRSMPDYVHSFPPTQYIHGWAAAFGAALAAACLSATA